MSECDIKILLKNVYEIYIKEKFMNQMSSPLKKIINRQMYNIKRLFYLATSVKIQSFKTFILPYFDNCLSLIGL